MEIACIELYGRDDGVLRIPEDAFIGTVFLRATTSKSTVVGLTVPNEPRATLT